jgi:rare lipoprotein A
MKRGERARLAIPAGLSVLALVLPGCGSQPTRTGRAPDASVATNTEDLHPKREPLCRKGNPASYDVFGKRYYLMKTAAGYLEQGIASWYGPNFQGHQTSCGNTYDMYDMTAAHKSLPIPTYVEVTNLDNGRKTIVKVNDRGPFHDDRIIDLSYAAALKLGIVTKGTGNVEVRALDAGLPIVAEGGELAQAPTPATPAASAAPTEPVPLTTTLSHAEATRLAAEVRTEPSTDPLATLDTSHASPEQAPGLALSASDRGTQLLPPKALAESRPLAIEPLAIKPRPVEPTTVSSLPERSASGGMFMQVGAFAQRDNAERLKSELDRVVEEDVRIQRSESRSGGFYRVHIGPLSNSAAAGRVSETLLRLGLPSHRLIVD